MSLAHLTSRRALAPHSAPIRRLVIITSVLFAAACGGDDDPTNPTGGPPSPTATVQATPGIRFTPATVELTVGGTVTFEFGTVPHNVFFDNAAPGAPENITAPTTSQAVTLTFPTAGQYRYNCHLHPGMAGTVNVR
jgi:plastocyanin